MDGARSMVERGDWLVPYYQGRPFFDKPILTYGLMAASFGAFGFDPGAARLVPALAALGVLAATAWLGLLLFDRRTALGGALVLATTLAFAVFGRVAMSDMLLALWSTLAVALAVRALRGPAPFAVTGLLAVLGLGFQTKGPVAILFPAVAILALAWPARDRVRAALRPWAVALGLVAFALLGLGWFAAVYRRLGAGPLEYFFLRENLERFAGETYDTGRPPWYYLGTYLAEGLPWSLFLPLAVRRGLRANTEGRRVVLSLLLFVAVMLVPLSLSRGKLDYYLLPLYPALSLVIARLFAQGSFDVLERAYTRVVLVLVGLAFAALPLARRAIAPEWLPAEWALFLVSGLVLAAALATLAAAANPVPGRVLAVLGGGIALVFVGLVTLLLPAFWSAQPNQAIVQDVLRERRFRPDAGVVACTDPPRVERDILFHARLAVERRCDLWSLAPTGEPYLFLLRPEERASLAAVPGFREISVHRYLPATVLTLGGLLAQPEPGVMTLAANFETDDPTAETKRKQDRKRALREIWGP